MRENKDFASFLLAGFCREYSAVSFAWTRADRSSPGLRCVLRGMSRHRDLRSGGECGAVKAGGPVGSACPDSGPAGNDPLAPPFAPDPGPVLLASVSVLLRPSRVSSCFNLNPLCLFESEFQNTHKRRRAPRPRAPASPSPFSPPSRQGLASVQVCSRTDPLTPAPHGPGAGRAGPGSRKTRSCP